ncbi:hypothetical protein BCR42DRAFT_412115 [Absidia repens]|uniref:N-formylglutamate amidohydrolase n=1 Tax=Absidia repens TaxID=90262 RepID=A0A1X2IKT1_9FUNG|nr:hypothetical protein BCR42DRAFT_412115 [Absidia repens]
MRGNRPIHFFLFFIFFSTISCRKMTSGNNDNSNKNNNQTPITSFFAEDIDKLQTVTLVEGHLPLIITVPHGSLNLPDSIPNRTEGQLVADAYTISVANQLSNQIQQHYKVIPYLVVFNVARRKVDVNRPINEGCESPQGRRVWKDYHNTLQKTVDTVKKRYGHGLLLDIHGQAHKEGMVELGYLLSGDALRSVSTNDSALVKQSSIQLLASRLQKSGSTATAAASLLRGNGSFGHAMMVNSTGNEASLSVQVVPSPSYPYPENGTLYFRGGYTTKRYHTTLDVIQVESPKSLRFSKEGRKLLCDNLAKAAIFMLDHYYLPNRSKL